MKMPDNTKNHRRGTVIDAGLHPHAYHTSYKAHAPGQPPRYFTHEKGGWIQVNWFTDEHRAKVRIIQVTRVRALQAMNALAHHQRVC